MEPTTTLMSLPDALAIKILAISGFPGARAATLSCRYFRSLDASDALWACMVDAAYPALGPTSPAVWGLQTFKQLCRALRGVERALGLYVSLSDFPWGQVLSVRLDAARGLLRGDFMPVATSENGARVMAPIPVFSAHLAALEDAPLSAGMPARALDRPCTLYHSDDGAPSEVAGPVLAAHTVQGAETRARWLANLSGVQRLFQEPHPAAQTRALHAGSVLLLELGDRQGPAGLAEPAQEALAEDGEPAGAANFAGPPLSVAWIADRLVEQQRQHAADAAEGSPFVCFGRLRRPDASWPQYPASMKDLLETHGLDSLPSLGYYVSDYGPMYGDRRFEVIQLRLVRLPGDVQGATDAELWHLRDHSQSRALRAGATYLIGVKVCGDCHVPQGATTFAVPVLDEHGAHAEPMLSMAPGHRDKLAWKGWGCLAYPGFNRHAFTDGTLAVIDDRSFEFAWRGASRHAYCRVALDEGLVSLGD